MEWSNSLFRPEGWPSTEGIDQLEMAHAVARAIASRSYLVAEAGTGTGKTLAYLVPAVLSRQRVLVSTGTKNLQEQIYFKDIPLLREALGVPFTAACMEGRGNYLCLHRFAAMRDDIEAGSPADRVYLEMVDDWAAATDTGDRAELGDLPEDVPFWAGIAATNENCIGSDCPEFDGCFVTRMRQRAAASDVVIVNHHLLCADAAVRQGSYGEVIPECAYAPEPPAGAEEGEGEAPEAEGGQFVFQATRRGLVKKTRLDAYSRPRASGIIALSIEEGDELIAARLTDGASHILLSTTQGMAIRFEEPDVRLMGRSAHGVKGITLEEGDEVVSAESLAPPRPEETEIPTILTVTRNGYGKRTELSEYRVQSRGGKGIITINTTERNGPVVAAAPVQDGEDVMLITNRGMLIRLPVKQISGIGRNTQGVRLIAVESNRTRRASLSLRRSRWPQS